MTIYLDMDGVIADFFGGLEKKYNVTHWKSIQDREIKFKELANTDFFNTLDPFYDDDGTNLSMKIVEHVIEMTYQHGIDWGICSSPLRGDNHNSSYWKRRWLENQGFVPPLIENMIFTGNKHKYAINPLDRKPNILIDDKPDNIRKWNEAGGRGILFQTNEHDIEEYLFVELERILDVIYR